jgi:mono/diheme cytochrome c family protein
MRLYQAAACILSFALLSCIEDGPLPAPATRVDAATAASQIEDGREIAATSCASCHAIGKTGASPDPKAPVWRSLLSRYDGDMLATELAEGMRVAHAPMPQFRFRPEAVDALLAYMRSVQTDDPGQILVETRCAQCHAIGRAGTSPYPGAQPFRNLGRRWSRAQLRDGLRTGIIVMHDTAEPRLPQMKLADAEITLLLDYLDTIATRENPAPGAR